MRLEATYALARRGDEESVSQLAEAALEPDAVDDPSIPVYETNAVERYFDGSDSRLASYGPGDVLLVIGADGRTFSNPSSATGFKRAVTTSSGGYTLVTTVPWALLGQHGGTVGFDVAVDGNVKGAATRANRLMWSGDGDAYDDPQQFGQLDLSR